MDRPPPNSSHSANTLGFSHHRPPDYGHHEPPHHEPPHHEPPHHEPPHHEPPHHAPPHHEPPHHEPPHHEPPHHGRGGCASVAVFGAALLGLTSYAAVILTK